jgi:hypothetical protein
VAKVNHIRLRFGLFPAKNIPAKIIPAKNIPLPPKLFPPKIFLCRQKYSLQNYSCRSINFDICLTKFEKINFYFIKLATNFSLQSSYLQGKLSTRLFT